MAFGSPCGAGFQEDQLARLWAFLSDLRKKVLSGKF